MKDLYLKRVKNIVSKFVCCRCIKMCLHVRKGYLTFFPITVTRMYIDNDILGKLLNIELELKLFPPYRRFLMPLQWTVFFQNHSKRSIMYLLLILYNWCAFWYIYSRTILHSLYYVYIMVQIISNTYYKQCTLIC